LACGDQRRLTGNGSALEVVLHDYALYKSTFTTYLLADGCRMISDLDRHRLRSSDIRTCVTPRKSTRFSDRSFSAAGPQVWNGLPSELQAPDLTFDRFKRGLKTYLFTLV